MTDLNKDQIISCIKAVLDSEIDMYIKSRDDYEEDTEDYMAIRVRGDTLLTLREKLKQIKGIY